jgi:hypothetical protein
MINLKISTIQKAAIDRYNITIDFDQANSIKERVLSNSQVYDLQNNIRQLPNRFWITFFQATSMITLLLALLAVLLIVTEHTDQFMTYLGRCVIGMIVGQIISYTYLYYFYTKKTKEAIKRQMYINLASLYHSMRPWQV